MNHDLLPRDLHLISVSISAPRKLTERSTVWCVSPSLRRRTLYPQQSMATVVLGRIHALMMASNVWRSNWRQVKDRCPQFPLNSNKDPCCRAQPAEPAITYFHIFTISTPPPRHKKSCKEQLKMKYDFALRQNCDQSATVSWSTKSSARHCRVKERRLTLNKSTDNNREQT